MKSISAFFCLLFFLFAANTAFAKVIEANIYPNGAVLTEQINAIIAPDSNRRTLLIYVPAQIQESSLNVTVPDATVLSLSTRRLMDFEQDPRRDELKKRLDQAQDALAVTNDAIQTLEARQAYWADPCADTADAAKMQQIDAAMQRNLTDILARVRELKRSKKEQEDRVAALAGAYEKAGATMVVMAALDRSISEDQVQAQCTYHTPQAFWRARYRFDARPQTSNVAMELSAEIVQDTGFTWDNATISLITLNPSGAILPPAVRPWIVRTIQSGPAGPVASAPRAMANAEAFMRDDSAMVMKTAGASVAPMAPQQESRGVYAVWNIGALSAASGTPVSVRLMEKELSGEFYDIVRPRLAGTAFLMAHVVFPSDQQMIGGQAAFFIDGAFAGESFFDPLNTAEPAERQSGAAATPKDAGNKTEYHLFFGPDRLVTCRYIELARTNDQSGILSKMQSKIWRWRVEVANKRAVPIRLRIEEAAPQLQDERIKLALKAQPEPRRTENNLYIWDAELKSKDMFTVNCEVVISAPEDINLNSTR